MRWLYEQLYYIFPLLSSSVLTLQCHSCSHSASVVNPTAHKCDSRGFCEGKWCSQTLMDQRILYGCDETSPLDGVRLHFQSFCHIVNFRGRRSFAYCYCKDGNYCNSAHSHAFNLLPVVFPFMSLLIS